MTADDTFSTSSQSTPQFDTASGATRTAVVLPWENPAGHRPRGADARLAEMVELAKSIGLEVVHTAVVPLARTGPPPCSAKARSPPSARRGAVGSAGPGCSQGRGRR